MIALSLFVTCVIATTIDDLPLGRYKAQERGTPWQLADKRGRELVESGNLSGAGAAFSEALALAEKAGEISPGIINSLLGLTLVAEKEGKSAEAERLYELAMRYGESRFGPDSPSFAALMPELAWLYHLHGKDDKGEVLFKRAIKIFQVTYGEDRMEAGLLREYKRFLSECGRHAEAEAVEHRLSRFDKQ